ncbi:hypothetical protein [Ammoniphilus sp. 3BR4]|uniref:hypothetical protein n=1 Tax=Ammoniphilus sp. 3BR4 TaxID=3158265 RepID=UPI00346696B7
MGNADKRMIAMSSLGQKGNGRFGNQAIQYAFVKIYSSQYSLGLETSPWVGQYLFGHKDPPVTHSFKVANSQSVKKYIRRGTIFKEKTTIC